MTAAAAKSNGALKVAINDANSIYNKNMYGAFMAFNYFVPFSKRKRYERGETLDWDDILTTVPNSLMFKDDFNTTNTLGSYPYSSGISTRNWLYSNTMQIIANGTQSGAGSYSYRTGVMTPGKRYKITLWMRSTNYNGVATAPNGFVAVSNPAMTSSDQAYVFEGISSDGTLVISPFAGTIANGTEAIINEISIVQLGCVANYTQDGITPLVWRDTVGGLDLGAVNTSASNLPADDNASIPLRSIVANSSIKLPAGYKIESFLLKNLSTVLTTVNINSTGSGSNIATTTLNPVQEKLVYPASGDVAFFSTTADTSIYLQSGAWTSPGVTVFMNIRKVI
jgi:hypothetical protein